MDEKKKDTHEGPPATVKAKDVPSGDEQVIAKQARLLARKAGNNRQASK